MNKLSDAREKIKGYCVGEQVIILDSPTYIQMWLSDFHSISLPLNEVKLLVKEIKIGNTSGSREEKLQLVDLLLNQIKELVKKDLYESIEKTSDEYFFRKTAQELVEDSILNLIEDAKNNYKITG